MIRKSVVALHGASKPQPGDSKLKHYKNVAVEGLRHLYHGFRLFGVNTRLAWKYTKRLRTGVALTRRERLLLERATLDLLRLVPFSFFIIVPFAEFLLPVALKMFPGLIPSTFETESQGRTAAFRSAMATMKARNRLTEHMTTTVVALYPQHAEIVHRAACNDSLNVRQIRSMAYLCAKDQPLGLHQLPPEILFALAVSIGVDKFYDRLVPKRFLVARLRKDIINRYRKVHEDDYSLDSEGMGDLSLEELVKANQMRGMRWTESKDTLALQLEWWVQLSKDPKVPYNALWWLKPTRYNLRKSMSDLPLDVRRQLLGINNLPPTLRDSLEGLCEKVEGKREEVLVDEQKARLNADQLANEVRVIADRAGRVENDIETKDVRLAIGNFLCDEANVDRLFTHLSRGATRDVTVSDAVDYVANETHMSSHVVSTVFDALEFDQGSKAISKKNLLAIGMRCKEKR
jgi:LETM1 and EF-hand domain-containing protein 1